MNFFLQHNTQQFICDTCINNTTAFKFYNQKQKQMSVLIQLSEQPQVKGPQAVKQILKQIFKSQNIVCRNIAEEGEQIIFFVKASKVTYRLTTVWQFNLALGFGLQVTFYNRAEDDFLRSYNDRMKIELSILTRMINDQVMPNFSFLCDNQTGVLKLIYNVSWSIFNQIAIKRQNIFLLIMNLFSQLRKYDELMVFVQPTFDIKQYDKNDKQKNPNIRVNRFRTVLKNTRNTRLQIQACIGDLLRLKQMNRQIYREQIEQIGSLYMRNIIAFQKSMMGLEEIDQLQINPISFEKQLKQIRKNDAGYTHYQKGPPNSKSTSNQADKILFGLTYIEPDKQINQKINQEGAHSQINRKIFKYSIAETIYIGTMSTEIKQYKRKQVRGELTYKTCNLEAETSINSFKNEIDAITYMKDMCSPFVARYYLQVKQAWNQKDIIYMNTYKQNVYHLLKAHKTLSVKMRLELAYKIAKGLCFLYSKQILHRDFKPQNVVVDSSMVPKILDFGSSISHYMKRSYKSSDERLLTTPGFHIHYQQIPPGYQYLRQKYNKKQWDEHPLFDVYGFGRTLCFIFFSSLHPPHPQSVASDPMFQVLENIIFLTQMCLNVDPDDRPGFGELTSFLGILKQLIKNVLTEESQTETQKQKEKQKQNDNDKDKKLEKQREKEKDEIKMKKQKKI